MKLIPLTQGLFAEVDDEDFVYLSRFKWRALRAKGSSMIYAARYERGNKAVLMHREILRIPDHVLGDHRDMNGLNNKRSNLRDATYTQNNANRRLQKNNTSGYRGVFWDKHRLRWLARIRYEKKRHHLGYFVLKSDAITAYNRAAERFFGAYFRGGES